MKDYQLTFSGSGFTFGKPMRDERVTVDENDHGSTASALKDRIAPLRRTARYGGVAERVRVSP
jgi:hypothetical protein